MYPARSWARRAIRSDLQYRTSFALFTFSQFAITFLDFVGILVLFANVDALAGWSLCRGGVPLRPGQPRVRAGRRVRLPGGERADRHPRRLVRPDPAAAGLRRSSRSSPTASAPAVSASSVQGVLVFGFATAAADIDWNAAGAAMAAVAVALGVDHLRCALGGDELDQLLVGRGPRGGQRHHLRRGTSCRSTRSASTARGCAAHSRTTGADHVRQLLPGDVHPRPRGPSGPRRAGSRTASPLVALRGRSALGPRLAHRRASLPEHGIRDRSREPREDASACCARPAGSAGGAEDVVAVAGVTFAPDPAPARWSATSARTTRASPPPSRC